jgi:hypothetical protein
VESKDAGHFTNGVGIRGPIDLAWSSLTFLVPAIVSLLSRMGATDLAYHVRAGLDILDTHALPRVDTYTFSVAGQPWLDQQWLAQLVFALVHRLGGWAGLAALQAFLASLSFGLIYMACRRRSATARTSALLTLGGFLIAAPTLAMRPQLLALPLFGGSLWILSVRNERRELLWLVPLFAAVCANLHGSFTLLAVLVGLAWLDDVRQHSPDASRVLVITVVTLGATLLNPFGVGAWSYAFDLSTNPIIRETISEWAPVTLATVPGWFMIGSAVAVAVFFARRRDPPTWTDILTLLVFFFLAMAAQRAIVWWALVAPIVVAGYLQGGSRAGMKASPPRRESAVPAYAIIAALVAFVAVLLPWWRGNTFDRQLSAAPPGLTNAVLEDLPAGSRLFAHQPWGSWFEYAAPSVKVFVDSRIEIIPRDVWVDYGEVGFAGAGWEDVLNRWQPDAVLADKEEWDLIPFLRNDPDWRVAYEDADGVLFVRA